MDSNGIPIKLLKQLDLISIISSESPTSCSLFLVQTWVLRSLETCLLHSLWHPGCLGAHDFPTNWAGACSPPNPPQHGGISMATDAHVDGSVAKWHWFDLFSGTVGQRKSIHLFCFCGFVSWLDAKCFLPLWPILRSIAFALVTSHPAVKSQYWGSPCSRDILLKKSATGRS